jgi:hypothetical protein
LARQPAGFTATLKMKGVEGGASGGVNYERIGMDGLHVSFGLAVNRR